MVIKAGGWKSHDHEVPPLVVVGALWVGEDEETWHALCVVKWVIWPEIAEELPPRGMTIEEAMGVATAQGAAAARPPGDAAPAQDGGAQAPGTAAAAARPSHLDAAGVAHESCMDDNQSAHILASPFLSVLHP